MHYKKRKLHRLHSIPIGLCNKVNHNRLYLVSYSIPLSCMVVLLLGLGFMVNPGLFLVDKSSAVTIQDEWAVKDTSNSNSSSDFDPDSISSENSNTLEIANNVSTDPVDNSFGGFGGDEVELSQEDTDAGISLQSVVTAPTLAITVGNSNQTIDAVQGGNTVYGSYNVGITGSNVKDYTLNIKADAVNLVSPSQASTPTTVAGAGGKTGNSMDANTWGYKLTETSTAESSYGTLNYASLPTALTQIANGTVTSPYNLSTHKKLVFAAKFSDTAAPGTYRGHITLSAVANQAVVSAIWSSGVDSGITDMQDISSGFCSSTIPAGSTITLKDNRGSSPISYKIIKMGDGTCWMAENLRLTNTAINSTNSDMTSGSFTIPASDISGFTSGDISSRKAYYADDTTYGAYYNWYTATAGATAASMEDAAGSICPKKWKLPAFSGIGSFYDIINGSNGYKGSWLTVGGKNGRKLGYDSDNAFWPAASRVYQSSLGSVGSSGYYWSRRAGPSANASDAYLLSFGSYSVNPQYSESRYVGIPVRCVATY